jgi:hypothetical protein
MSRDIEGPVEFLARRKAVVLAFITRGYHLVCGLGESRQATVRGAAVRTMTSAQAARAITASGHELQVRPNLEPMPKPFDRPSAYATALVLG